MSNSLCKYKNVFGEPGKGVHSYRFMGVAIIDVVFTVIGAFLISYFTGWNLLYTLSGLFLAGIFFHKLFCVDTTINRLLFG